MRRPMFLIPNLALALCLAGCGSGSAAAPAKVGGSTTTTSAAGVELPYQEAAELAACPADAETLKLAEQSYAMLNGAYATIQQLVAGQFIAAPSKYFVAVRMGTPRGGYTLVGGPKCGNVPVAR